MVKKDIKGEIISPGIAEGILRFVNLRLDTVISKDSKDSVALQDVAREIARFEEEVGSTIQELSEAIRILEKEAFFKEAEIIRTHILMLRDSQFQKRVQEKIKAGRLAAEIALERVLEEMVEVLESSENMVFVERAGDLKDIGMRLRKKLNREDRDIFREVLKNVSNPVVITKELFPWLVLEGREEGVKAFIVAQGTALSHAAILAKSFGLPVVKLEGLYSLGLESDTRVFVDAIKGRVLIEPSEEEIVEIESLPSGKYELREPQSPVKIWLNIVDPLQVKEEDLKDVEGIGLYRTEVLFMKKDEDFPSEDEQYIVYSSLFKKCKGYPVTIRTLDIGGDKTLPYFSFGPQENPYLGFRAHRIYRFHPEIFVTQIRAILRAGVQIDGLRILYPMIESVDDLHFVQALLTKAINSLKEEGIEFKENFWQGVLIEVPSAVWSLPELLRYVDFASVGTNDLLQYIFAVDRNSANVYNIYQPEKPVVLKVLKALVDIAKSLDKPLSICGEIASDINFLPLLVGLGFNTLSVDSHTVKQTRQYLLSLDVPACKRLIQACLNAERTDEVKILLSKFNSFYKGKESKPTRKGDEFIDPVCNMVVHTQGNELFVIHDGRKYYFCRRQCRDEFVKKTSKEIQK